MPRIERPPVQPDIGAISAQLGITFGAIVTRLAERLQLAGPEPIDVAAVRLNVVADCRRNDQPALEAERAQRVR